MPAEAARCNHRALTLMDEVVVSAIQARHLGPGRHRQDLVVSPRSVALLSPTMATPRRPEVTSARQ
jgi:hypothetical protein